MTSLRPSDFGKFWYGLGKELSDIDSCPEISTLPMSLQDLQIYTV